MPEQQPCWPECKEMLLLQLKSEIERVEAILTEREKATQLLAKNEISAQQGELTAKFVLRDAYQNQIDSIKYQLIGPYGLEMRMRELEQGRGATDAKLYMVIVGIPIAVSAIMSLILPHFMK